MRVLCGQCGKVHVLDDDLSQPTVACSQCGHIIPVPRFDAPELPESEELQESDFVEIEAEEMGFAEQARKTDVRKIKITCVNCGKTVFVSARVAGMKARCKGCDHPLQIPYPDDLEEFELPKVRRDWDEEEVGLQLLPGTEGVADRSAEAPPAQPVEAAEPAAEEPVTWVSREAAKENAAKALEQVSQRSAERAPEEALAEAFAQSLETAEPAPVTPEHEELAKAVGAYDGRRRAARRSPLRWLLLLLAGVAAIGLPIAILIPVLGIFDPKDPNKVPAVGVGLGGDGNRLLAIHSPNSPSATRPRTPVEPPKPKVPTCQIVSVDASVFANGGYFPAQPQMIYWKVTATLSAGAKGPIKLNNHGNDVTLTVGTTAVPSLGATAGEGLFPVRSRKGTIELQPDKPVTTTFLFDVPHQAAKGKLFVRGVAEVDVQVRPDVSPPAPVAGTYLEADPRNLKPMLREPVMAAIQSAPHHRLLVAQAPTGLEVSIPEALVSGLAQPIAAGLFRAPLRHAGNGNALNCTLRFLEGGRRLVLYLADEPFHQLSYINPKVKPPAPPAPKPEVAVKPRPADPDASAARPAKKPGRNPDGPGLGKTIWQEVPGYDPNAKPTTKDPARLPTGPSIFD